MASHVLVVFTNPVEGREDEFNEWYDTIHLPDLLKVTGVVSGQRYVAETTPEGAPTRYLTIYQIDAEPDAVVKEMTERVMSGEFKMSEAIDLTKMALWGFKAHPGA